MSRLDVLTRAPVVAPVVEDYEAGEARLCDVCNKPMGSGWLWRHTYHDDGCPNQRWEKTKADDDMPYVDCECDNVCHAECCPSCAPHVILQSRALVRWYWSGTRHGWTGDRAKAHQYANIWRAERARDRLVRDGRYNVLNTVDVMTVAAAEQDYNDLLAFVESRSKQDARIVGKGAAHD